MSSLEPIGWLPFEPRDYEDTRVLQRRILAGEHLAFPVVTASVCDVEDAVEKIIALANTESGGVLYGDGGPGLQSGSLFPDRYARDVVDEVIDRSMPEAPRLRANWLPDAVIIVVHSALDQCAITFDCADGNHPAFRYVCDGAVRRSDGAVTRVARIDDGWEAIDDEWLPIPFPGKECPLAGGALASLDDGLRDHVCSDELSTSRGVIDLFGTPKSRRALRAWSLVIETFGCPEAEARVLDASPASATTYEGSLVEFLGAACEFAEAWGRRQSAPPEFVEAFREIAVNGVAHHSLSESGYGHHCMRVRGYLDSLAVESVGPPPRGHVAIVDGRFDGRWSRNPTMCDILTRMDWMRQGSGGFERARRMVAPTMTLSVTYDEGYTIARFEFSSPDTMDAGHSDASEEAAATEVTAEQSFGPGPQSTRDRVLTVLGDGARSTREVAEELGVSKATATAALKALVASRHVERTESNPNSPNQRYRRAP